MSRERYLEKSEVLEIITKINTINNSYCDAFNYFFNQKLSQNSDYTLLENELNELDDQLSDVWIGTIFPVGSDFEESEELLKLIGKYQDLLYDRINLLLEMVSKLHKKAEGGKYSIFKYSSNLKTLKRLEKTSSNMGKEFEKFSHLWKSEDTKDDIGVAQAVILFVDEVQKDSLEDWVKVQTLLKKYSYVINESESKDIFFIGKLAVDTIHSYEILDYKTAKSINSYIEHYMEYQTNVTKEYPDRSKEAFSLFTNLYRDRLDDFWNDSKSVIPSFTTSMFVLLCMLNGLECDSDSMPPKQMAFEFYEIVLNKLGRWNNLTSKYNIQWLD